MFGCRACEALYITYGVCLRKDIRLSIFLRVVVVCHLVFIKPGGEGVFAIEKNPCAYATLSHNLIENKHHFDWPEWLPQRY